MKDLIIKAICLLLIVLTFVSYDVVLAMRDRDEQIAELTAQIESTQSVETGKGSGGDYKDGTYTGSAEGYGGTVTMEVVIKDGSIAEINTVSASGETPAYWAMCEALPDEIVEKQSPEVDAVSGATFSSTGIINAVIDALNQAM